MVKILVFRIKGIVVTVETGIIAIIVIIVNRNNSTKSSLKISHITLLALPS